MASYRTASTTTTAAQTGGPVGNPLSAGQSVTFGGGGASPVARARRVPTQQRPTSTAPVAGAMPVNARAYATTAPATAAPAASGSPYETWRGTAAGQTTGQGANPYNPNAPRYNGYDDQDIAWAEEASTARRPDGSYAYKASERNHAASMQEAMRTQDRELADPSSGTSLRARFGAYTDRAGQQAAAAGQGYQTAASGVARGDADTSRRINAVETWSPTEQEGFDTDYIRNQQPTARQGWSAAPVQNFQSTNLEGYAPTASRGVNTGALRGYDAGGAMASYLQQNGGGAEDWDTSATGYTSSYDPAAAVNEYARGAAGEAKYVLSDQLESLANASARSGRLNTGLFDKDNGTVVRRVGEDLNSKISQQAVAAAGIRAGIENNNTNNQTSASIASARERGAKGASLAGLRSAEARDAAGLGLDALTSATGYDVDLASEIDRLTLDRAGQIDSNRLTAADATTRYQLQQAEGIDDFNQKNTIAHGDLELRRRQGVDDGRYTARRDAMDGTIRQQGNRLTNQSLAQELWNSTLDREGDALSSERDRVTAAENYERELEQRRAESRNQMWGSAIGGATRLATAFL